MAHSPNTILLQRYYSGGPVCSPIRGTVLTGRNYNRYCVWGANTGQQTRDFKIPETMPLPLSDHCSRSNEKCWLFICILWQMAFGRLQKT